MGDEHDGLMEAVGKAADHVHDLLGGLGIEVAGRLVGKHHLGPRDKRARDADALLLSAGHLVGKVIHAVLQSHAAEHLSRLQQPRLGRHALEHQRHGHVLRRRQLRQQVVGLEHEADVLLPKRRELILIEQRDRHAADAHHAARGLFKPRQLVEQRRFSAAGRAENAAHLAARNIQIDIVQRDHVLLPHHVHLAELSHLYDGRLVGFHRSLLLILLLLTV